MSKLFNLMKADKYEVFKSGIVYFMCLENLALLHCSSEMGCARVRRSWIDYGFEMTNALIPIDEKVYIFRAYNQNIVVCKLCFEGFKNLGVKFVPYCDMTEAEAAKFTLEEIKKRAKIKRIDPIEYEQFIKASKEGGGDE